MGFSACRAYVSSGRRCERVWPGYGGCGALLPVELRGGSLSEGGGTTPGYPQRSGSHHAQHGRQPSSGGAIRHIELEVAVLRGVAHATGLAVPGEEKTWLRLRPGV